MPTDTATDTRLIDGHARQISYARLSITDRCDFRCHYCMAETMTFLPRADVLSLEEIERVAAVLVGLGVRKLRVTGGEPLVRRGVVDLVARLAGLDGLRELAMTTNGSRLALFAEPLRAAGLDSLNISLDTLDPAGFRALTRTGSLDDVLAGIGAAIAAGFPRIRLNAVILRGQNVDQVLPLTEFAVARGVDIAFIEEMPLGQVTAAGKALELVTSDEVLEILAGRFDLLPDATGGIAGPARYQRVAGTNTRVGVISPHSNNFCSSCNRIRVTAEGRLLLCLGNEHSISLRDLLRRGHSDAELADAVTSALLRKPERHHFDQPDGPQVLRFMNASGG